MQDCFYDCKVCTCMPDIPVAQCLAAPVGGRSIHRALVNWCIDAGARGERRELARGPLEETARFTQQTLDTFKESSDASASMISKLQDFGKDIASKLFD